MSLRPELKLDWCSYKAAKFAVEHWHYSRKMPASKTVKIGVWEDGRFIGAVVFSRGTCGHLFNRFGLKNTEGCELTRVALGGHSVHVSRVLSIATRLLKKQSPGLRLLVSFAAKSEGHHGGIYQAAGWVYDGETAYKQEYEVGGRRITDRTVSEWVRNGRVKRANLAKMYTETKHRYLMPLDAEMRSRIIPLSKPYPKRAVSIDNDAPASHAGEGGEIPTTALHIQE